MTTGKKTLAFAETKVIRTKTQPENVKPFRKISLDNLVLGWTLINNILIKEQTIPFHKS